MKTKELKKGIALFTIVFIIIGVLILGTAVFFIIKYFGNIDNQGPNDQTLVDNMDNEQVETEQEKETLNWTLKEIDFTSILPTTKVEEIVLFDKIKQKVATTPFNYDISEIKDQLSNNEFIKDNYALAQEDYEQMKGEVYTDVGAQSAYKYSKSVQGILKDNLTENTKYFNDFVFELSGDTNYYTNYKDVYIYFANIDFNTEVQQSMYSILNETIGNDFANILVYGKDLDDSDYNLNEIVDIEGIKYKLRRTLNEDSKTVTFSIGINSLPFHNSFSYYSGNYKSIYNDFEYPVTKIVSSKIGSTSLSEFNKFADKYMKLGTGTYARTLFDNGYTISKKISDNGIKCYSVNIQAKKGSSDVLKWISQELEIDYDIWENKDGMFDFDMTVEGEPGYYSNESDEQSSYNKLINIMNSQIEMLFSDIDVSSVKYSNLDENKTINAESETTILDQKRKVSIYVKVGRTFADTFSAKFEIKLK